MGRTGAYVRCLWVEGQNYDVTVSGMLGLFNHVSNNAIGHELCTRHRSLSHAHSSEQILSPGSLFSTRQRLETI